MPHRILRCAIGLASAALAARCAQVRPATIVSPVSPTSCVAHLSEDTTVYDTTQVSENPIFHSGPWLDYPEALRMAGVQGSVVVVATIAPMGQADRTSIKVIQSVHPAL